MHFNHGLAEIITALMDAGLRLTAFEEHDSVPWNPLGTAMEEDLRLRFPPDEMCDISLPASSFQALKVQFVALGLITLSDRKRGVHDKGTYWKLTPYGVNYVMKLMAQKRP